MELIIHRPAHAVFFLFFWLLFLTPLSASAADDLSIRLGSVHELRQVAGAEEMRVTVGSRNYDWDRYAIEPDDGVRWVRPDFPDILSGRWRAAGAEPARYEAMNRETPSPTCPGSLQVAPQLTGEYTYRVLRVALAQAAKAGCPVEMLPGIHPVDRDLVIDVSNVEIHCKTGVVFKKLRSSNVFWFRGDNIQLTGKCEIDGMNNNGSGLIIDFSARGAQIVNVYSHDHGGHGVLNRGLRTVAEYIRTENNGEIGFANDAAKEAKILHLISRNNGNEGLTIDNPGTNSVVVLGGFLEGNCRKGGVGNLGVDAAVNVNLEGMVLRNPSAACPWNLTAQNNAGNTDRLSIRGGYYVGATAGDIRFRTNVDKGYTVRDSIVSDIISVSHGHAISIDAGGERNNVNVKGYTGRFIMDMH